MEHMIFECILGMECSTFTILAADQKNTHGILVMKNDQNKLFEINKNIILGMNGDSGDVGQLTNYIEKNLALYKLKNGYDLDMEAMVHFTSRTLCDSLRTQTPFIVSSLVGGYSKEKGGQLFYLDLFGSRVPLPFGAHGIAGLFTMGLMMEKYHRNLTREQAYEILRLCVREIQQRYSINLGSFQVKVVDENGITELPVIKEECFF